ncbi:MAG: phosphopantothenoylcysteine decarboxylase [Elusimicrobiota bacterium]|jgi:phosphopantothenoylcysteine synthetase/decarboxylase|nr:phosphopantothenoylcysteine decarboxylase [Elusimicrobiota bacterium]
MSKTIILGITASIAAYKSCDIVRAFIKEGHSVECVLTKNAEHFITPLSLQTLSNNQVHRSMFDKKQNFDIAHISLAKKADIILIAPASADIIAKLACGIADDLLTTTVLASKAKVIICPAMNSAMYEHKATVKNMQTLIEYGYKIIEAEDGGLACKDIGKGRLASTDKIVKEALL